jgi:hypothetical protein
MRWVAALAVLAAAIVTPSAAAGGPGVWTQISSGPQQNIDELGLARMGGGVLHVVWRRQNGSSPSVTIRAR